MRNGPEWSDSYGPWSPEIGIALRSAERHRHGMAFDPMVAIPGLHRWSCQRCARSIIQDPDGRLYGDAIGNQCVNEPRIRDYLIVGGTIREAHQAAALSNFCLRDWDWLPRFQPLSYYRHIRRPYDPRPVFPKAFR